MVGTTNNKDKTKGKKNKEKKKKPQKSITNLSPDGAANAKPIWIEAQRICYKFPNGHEFKRLHEFTTKYWGMLSMRRACLNCKKRLGRYLCVQCTYVNMTGVHYIACKKCKPLHVATAATAVAYLGSDTDSSAEDESDDEHVD